MQFNAAYTRNISERLCYQNLKSMCLLHQFIKTVFTRFILTATLALWKKLKAIPRKHPNTHYSQHFRRVAHVH